MAGDATKPVTLSFNVYINTINSLDNSTNLYGSDLVYSITVVP